MRNISFALTTQQMRDRTKTVTRRRGTFYARVLKPGDLVCAVEKSQGIKKGGLVRLGTIRVKEVWVEPLSHICNYPFVGAEGQYEECVAEGFPELQPPDFVRMFCTHMGGAVDQIVTRIEFEHVKEQA